MVKEPKQLTEYKESLEGLLALFASYAEAKTKHQEDLWRVNQYMKKVNETHDTLKGLHQTILDFEAEDQSIKSIYESMKAANTINENFYSEEKFYFDDYELKITEKYSKEPDKKESTRAVQVTKDKKKDALKHAFDNLSGSKEFVSTKVYGLANEYLKRESKADGNFYTNDLLEECGWSKTDKKDGVALILKKGVCKWRA